MQIELTIDTGDRYSIECGDHDTRLGESPNETFWRVMDTVLEAAEALFPRPKAGE